MQIDQKVGYKFNNPRNIQGVSTRYPSDPYTTFCPKNKSKNDKSPQWSTGVAIKKWKIQRVENIRFQIGGYSEHISSTVNKQKVIPE